VSGSPPKRAILPSEGAPHLALLRVFEGLERAELGREILGEILEYRGRVAHVLAEEGFEPNDR
jgi:hypothetical protein